MDIGNPPDSRTEAASIDTITENFEEILDLGKGKQTSPDSRET